MFRSFYALARNTFFLPPFFAAIKKAAKKREKKEKGFTFKLTHKCESFREKSA